MPGYIKSDSSETRDFKAGPEPKLVVEMAEAMKKRGMTYFRRSYTYDGVVLEGWRVAPPEDRIPGFDEEHAALVRGK